MVALLHSKAPQSLNRLTNNMRRPRLLLSALLATRYTARRQDGDDGVPSRQCFSKPVRQIRSAADHGLRYPDEYQRHTRRCPRLSRARRVHRALSALIATSSEHGLPTGAGSLTSHAASSTVQWPVRWRAAHPPGGNGAPRQHWPFRYWAVVPDTRLPPEAGSEPRARHAAAAWE